MWMSREENKPPSRKDVDENNSNATSLVSFVFNYYSSLLEEVKKPEEEEILLYVLLIGS